MRCLNPTGTGGQLWVRVIWVVALGAFLFTATGCSYWKARPVYDVEAKADKYPGKTVKFTMNSGAHLVMHVTEVDYPFIRGVPPETVVRETGYATSAAPGEADEAVTTIKTPESYLEVDCRDVYKLEVKETNVAGSVIAIAMAATVFVIIVAGLSDSGGSYTPPPSSSSQSSCPVLYVERDGIRHLVGEPYAGAAVGALERQDLLPVPGLETGRNRLVMTNEARETQYTDFAELVIADHPAHLRAVATHDQRVLLVGPPQAPLKAVDTSGREVTASVLARDELVWQTDLTPLMDVADPGLTEEVVFTFPRPAPGESPVLELNLSNTYWLDYVMNRFFALMGDQFQLGMQRAARSEMRGLLASWKEREGIDLKVEVQAAGGWREAGHVISAGPLALRQVAVPLPEVQPGQASGELTVRVTGGVGFWKIDQAALSCASSEAPRLRSVAPAAVTGAGGRDESALLANVDGQYQVLPQVGDRVDLEFDLPPAEQGLARTAFFHTSGYYEAHQPLDAENSLARLKTIADQPGGLAAFSLEVFRKFHEIALATPRRPEAAQGSY
jgi:hypothetical protein